MPAAPILGNSFSGRIFGKVHQPAVWWFTRYVVKGDGLTDDHFHIVYKPMHRDEYFELDMDEDGVVKSFYVPKATFDAYKEGDIFICGRRNSSAKSGVTFIEAAPCPPQAMPGATVSTVGEATEHGAKEE